MKKLLLLSFSVFGIIFGFQQESETQTTSLKAIQAIERQSVRSELMAFDLDLPETGFKPVEEAELRAASARAIKLIQHAQVVWSQKETCTSCHHQLLPEFPLKLARERGIQVDEVIARDLTTSAFAYLKDLDMAVQGYDYIDVFFDGWALTTADRVGIRPNLSTSAYAQFIASRQLADGSWPTIDARPPQAHSRFAATAVCVQAIRQYLPAQLKIEQESRVSKAREWLLKTQPKTTEDRAFQLLGLQWTGASEHERQKVVRELLNEQREDSGWSQLPSRTSDAYATGEVLVALREGGGLATTDTVYQRGLRFLINSQAADGSWRVKSRLHPPAPLSPPYVDTEFPYQHDQFISIMGTSWAVAACLHAIPSRPEYQLKQPAPLDLAAPEESEWVRIVLNGSVDELKTLLDQGMSPDAKTAGGTTALMLAVRDLKKVKLLIERGAKVNVGAATGITPLMVAARYKGNVSVVRLLLKSGAIPNVCKGVVVRNDASPLSFAVMSGDLETAEALLDAGARLGVRIKILGLFAVSLMNSATVNGDAAMIEYLIGKGANPNDIDDDGISVLGWATLTNHADVVQTLLQRGARVNYVDKRGMTPLLYAASIDFGDTAVLEKLIAAGADLKAKNRQGLTALDLANQYGHRAIANKLAGSKPAVKAEPERR